MIVICAWCKQKIDDGGRPKNTPEYEVSHGICRPCKEYFFSSTNRTLEKVLNRLDAPVLVVNQQAEVVAANDQALQILDKELDAVNGLRGGEAMECTYAKLPEGCGNTLHCAVCTVRSNVMKTFADGKSLCRVPAFLNRQNRNSIHRIRFLISTEKVNDVVLLKIEDISEES